MLESSFHPIAYIHVLWYTVCLVYACLVLFVFKNDAYNDYTCNKVHRSKWGLSVVEDLGIPNLNIHRYLDP